MPLIQDYSAEDDDQKAFGSGGSKGAGGGAAAQAEPSPQKEAEFVPWSRFVGANQEVSQREAGKLQSQVQGDVDRAKKGAADASNAFNAAVDSNYLPGRDDELLKPKGPASGSIAAPAPAESAFADQSPNAGNPWASFLSPPDAPAPASTPNASGLPAGATALPTSGLTSGTPKGGPTAKDQAAARQTAAQQVQPETAPIGMLGALNPDKLKTDVKDGAPLTSGYELGGSESLEKQLGADPWAKLLGDTQRAGSEANALGTDAGLQGLLETNTGSGSAFDAALIGGEGSKGFQDLASKYGKGQLSEQLTGANAAAQDRWAQLQGDVKTAAGARDTEIRAATDEMNRLAKGQATVKNQQERDADAATNRPELEAARTNFANGVAAYSAASQVPGGPEGSVNGLGTSKQFLDALKSGAQYGDGAKWENTPGVKEQMDAASKALGLSPDVLAGYFERMTSTEWIDFWCLGVVPPWMEGAKAFGYGKPGGWKAPYLEGVAQYGDDGGMWNAITNMWKDSAVILAESAASPASAVVGAGKAATYKGPGGGK